MSQRTVHSFAAAAALAAVLFLAAAAPAQARDLSSTQAWQGLQDLWAKAVSVLWPWGGWPKAAPATDPDGSPKPGSTAPPAGTAGDAGLGTDPNG